MKFIVSISVVLLFFKQALPFVLSSGSRADALLGCSIAMNTTYNYNDNPASLLNSKFNGFTPGHSLNYFAKELDVSSITFSHHLAMNSLVTAGIDRSGNKAFNETNFNLGVAKKLGEKINAGIKLNYYQLNYEDKNYSDIPLIIPEIYLFAKASGKICLGFMVGNPLHERFNNNFEYPTYIVAGASYLPSEKVRFAFIAKQKTGNEIKYCLGVEYLFVREFEFRIAYETVTNTIASGFTLIVKKFQLEFAMKIQQMTGNAPSVTLLIPVR